MLIVNTCTTSIMSILGPQRKRLELLFTFIIGLVWGIGLAPMMQRNLPLAAPGGLNPIFRSESRILCVVLTSPKRQQSHAEPISQTWAKRCDKLLFMSSQKNAGLGIVSLPVRDGYSHQWAKTRESLRFVSELSDLDDFDWILKTNDDTYVVMENLRSFLSVYAPTEPVYFGSELSVDQEQEYLNAGAGFVLSRTALERFMTLAYGNSSICAQHSFGLEEVQLARCLRNANVVSGNTITDRDENTILPFIPKRSLKSVHGWQMIMNTSTSDVISFHYDKPIEFHVLEYLIYKIQRWST